MITISKDSAVQFIKYAVVGVMNTLVTLIIIFVCKSLMGVNEYVANALGYVGGLINSFMWNRTWVFHAGSGWKRQAVRFGLGFAICYALQFAIVWTLTERTPYGNMVWDIYGFSISGYGVATLIGMVAYTLANFVYNKLFAFK